MWDKKLKYEEYCNVPLVPATYRELEPILSLGYTPVQAGINGYSLWFKPGKMPNGQETYPCGSLLSFYRNNGIDKGIIFPLDPEAQFFYTIAWWAVFKEIKSIPVVDDSEIPTVIKQLRHQNYRIKFVHNNEDNDNSVYGLIKDDNGVLRLRTVVIEKTKVKDDNEIALNYDTANLLVECWSSADDGEDIKNDERSEKGMLSTIEEFLLEVVFSAWNKVVYPSEWLNEADDGAPVKYILKPEKQLQIIRTDLFRLGLLDKYDEALKEHGKVDSPTEALDYYVAFTKDIERVLPNVQNKIIEEAKENARKGKD